MKDMVPVQFAAVAKPSEHARAAPPPVLALENFGVAIRQGGASVPVVHGIELALAPGEALGIVGESGCGKSITWLAALRLLGPRVTISGRALLAGRNLAGLGEREMAGIRGGRIGLIFQDPASCLNPVRRIGWQICEALALHRGLHGAEARSEARRLLDRVGIADAERRLNQYPHELSGGMNQRVMIAIALAGEPDVLIADEPTTALDATVQAQILDLLRDIRRDTGMGLVLISHDLGVVADLCDRVAVMYAGRIVETGEADRLLTAPRHPYTQGLLAALPDLAGPRVRLTAIPGTVPAPHALPPGCAFAPRCAQAAALCDTKVPVLAVGRDGHGLACLRGEALPDTGQRPRKLAEALA
ncbi:ABC transporter ATP-binding protein [Chelatococcus sp. GCM10030263]|uniref:ABC transporter ATP-binding protein n=1 Tax=Chelatococcus sp. GCM10030263 TaxID=3273387 RepID=UPI00360CEAF2